MAGDRAEIAIQTYAYLTASFRAGNDVSDLIDCLMPFIAASALKNPDRPIIIADVAADLERYGLKIPLYSLSQLIPRLARRGLVEWSPIAKAYMPVSTKLVTEQTPDQLLEDFSDIEAGLQVFASSLHDFSLPPVSASWNDALVSFLKSDKLRGGLKSVLFKRAIVSDFSSIEWYIIARFIQNCYTNAQSLFERITRVYTGVIIEDFINNVQALGKANDFKGLSVFYDTPVLLRLVGASGRLLQTATLEMHDSLKALGCDLFYFDINRAEAENILSAITAAGTIGQELYGETAEAIYDGDIDVAWLKDLLATLEVRLGQLNVFPYSYVHSARVTEDVYQIDEPRFAAALESAALAEDRSYKRENANNDAAVLALIWRLRKGHLSRDIAKSKYVFVSKNGLLQKVARKYGIDHIDYFDGSTPSPVFTLGQITTATWLLTEKKISPHKVSQELLANCYAAVKPSASWASEYAKAFDDLSSEDKTAVLERTDALLILRATREYARDESLNDPNVLKRLNLAAIFRQAQANADETMQKVEANHKAQLHEQLSAARDDERRQAIIDTQNDIREQNIRRAETVSRVIVVAIQIALLVIIIVITAFEGFEVFTEGSWLAQTSTVLAFILAVIAALDLSGITPVKAVLDKLRAGLALQISYILNNDRPL